MRIRRVLTFLTAAFIASLFTAAAPAVQVDAARRVPVRAQELSQRVDRERVFQLPFEASHVALHWPGRHDADVRVAFSTDGTTFGAATGVDHDEVGEQRGNGETYGVVLVAGAARAVRVTTDQPLPRLSVLVLDSRGDARGTAWSLGGVARAAHIDQPPVVTRAGWGADESLRYDENGNEIWTPAFYPVQKLIVHHTAGKNDDPDPAATIRSIYYYHAVTQGWGDIGYNFLIDEAGNVYEGRHSRYGEAGYEQTAPYPTGEDANQDGVTAAHAVNYNSGTVGMAFLGNLVDQDATPAAKSALERLLAWKAERHGLDPEGFGTYVNPVNGVTKDLYNIAGHRDVAATECPGGTFYNTLPSVRSNVAAIVGGVEQSVPGAPVLSAATASSRKGVDLTWTVPHDGNSAITGYRIYRGTSPGSSTLLKSVGASTTSYRDTNTRRGRTYYYTVAAVNSVGVGDRSNEASATAR